MATAELAACLPVLVLILGVALTAVSVVGARVRVEDAAREAARAAARGDTVTAQRLAERAAPGARLTISRTGDDVTAQVRVTVRPLGDLLPTFTVDARAVAAKEPDPSGRLAVNDDRGAASVWVVAACALLLVVAGASSMRGVAVLARHRAEAAADLAALAAAERIGVGGSPCTAAARIADANGARLRTCRLTLDPDARSGTVLVSVSAAVPLPVVGRQRVDATARAARLPANP